MSDDVEMGTGPPGNPGGDERPFFLKVIWRIAAAVWILVAAYYVYLGVSTLP